MCRQELVWGQPLLFIRPYTGERIMMASKKRPHEGFDVATETPTKKQLMQRDYELMSQEQIADFDQDYIIYHVSQAEASAVTASPFVPMSAYVGYANPESAILPSFCGFVNALESRVDLQQKAVKLRVDASRYGDLGLLMDFNFGVSLEKALACAVEFLKRPGDTKFAACVQNAESLGNFGEIAPTSGNTVSGECPYKLRGDALGACVIIEDISVKDSVANVILAPV